MVLHGIAWYCVDYYENISGRVRVLLKIIGSGRVSGTRLTLRDDDATCFPSCPPPCRPPCWPPHRPPDRLSHRPSRSKMTLPPCLEKSKISPEFPGVGLPSKYYDGKCNILDYHCFYATKMSPEGEVSVNYRTFSISF